MLPYKKSDQPFKSLPVSRVSSSQRLNQISTPGNNVYASIPSTPTLYVSSSLNPSRNLPVTSSSMKSKITTKEELDKFETLPIVEKVREFEKTLNDLSNKISSYKEDEVPHRMDSLISLSKIITSEISELEKHQELGKQIHSLEEERDNLDERSKYILKELITYRNKLKKLPRLPASQKKAALTETQKNDVDIKEVLKYAMKLAKFTKAPPTVANALFQVHPNNYVWPAEDALRRGMLALSSIRGDEIIKSELGESKTIEPEVSFKEETEEEEEVQKDSKAINLSQHQRRGSFGQYGTTSAKDNKHDEQANALNLDLFDPDDDEYSD